MTPGLWFKAALLCALVAGLAIGGTLLLGEVRILNTLMWFGVYSSGAFSVLAVWAWFRRRAG